LYSTFRFGTGRRLPVRGTRWLGFCPDPPYWPRASSGATLSCCNGSCAFAGNAMPNYRIPPAAATRRQLNLFRLHLESSCFLASFASMDQQSVEECHKDLRQKYRAYCAGQSDDTPARAYAVIPGPSTLTGFCATATPAIAAAARIRWCDIWFRQRPPGRCWRLLWQYRAIPNPKLSPPGPFSQVAKKRQPPFLRESCACLRDARRSRRCCNLSVAFRRQSLQLPARVAAAMSIPSEIHHQRSSGWTPARNCSKLP